jgi:hypothetical protein
MRSIASHDQISRQGCSIAQRCLDCVVVLIEILDAGTEAIVGPILRRLIQHIDQIATQDL